MLDEQIVNRVLAGNTALYKVLMRRYNTRILIALVVASAILPFASLWLCRDPVGGRREASRSTKAKSALSAGKK